MEKVALVDGDVIRYRVGFASEKNVYTVQYVHPETQELVTEEFSSKKEIKELTQVTHAQILKHEVHVDSVENCLHSVKQVLSNIKENTNATKLHIFLSGVGNYRKEIYPEYKANRPDKKPFHYQNISDYLIKHCGAIVIDGMEADDALAIFQEGHPRSVICSIDKDLLQIPGEHYNFVTQEHRNVSEYEGLINLYRQILMGDRTDNVPGLAGIGEAKANKILDGCETEREMFERALDAYKGDIDALTLTARLVYLKRYLEDEWTIPEETIYT